MRNEHTSKRVARIAARILRQRPRNGERAVVYLVTRSRGDLWQKFLWSDIRALAASCLMQAPDRKSPKTKKRKPISKLDPRDAKVKAGTKGRRY